MAPHPRDYNLSLPDSLLASYGSIQQLGQLAQLARYESISYDHNTMQYKTEGQSRKINELEEKLQEKEIKRARDLKSIIGHYYKR